MGFGAADGAVKPDRDGFPREARAVRSSALHPAVDVAGVFINAAPNLFFQLISDRYEQGSLMITSNLPFSQWGEILGSTTIATAIIDRVVHHAQVLQTSGKSYRLRNRDQPNPVK